MNTSHDPKGNGPDWTDSVLKYFLYGSILLAAVLIVAGLLVAVR
jgi:hypothetical protein